MKKRSQSSDHRKNLENKNISYLEYIFCSELWEHKQYFEKCTTWEQNVFPLLEGKKKLCDSKSNSWCQTFLIPVFKSTVCADVFIITLDSWNSTQTFSEPSTVVFIDEEKYCTIARSNCTVFVNTEKKDFY